MEKFKIKNIEEFDLDFVAKYNKPAAEDPAADLDNDLKTDDIPEAETQTDNNDTQILFDEPQPAVPYDIPAQQQTPTQVAPLHPQPAEKSKPEKVKQSGLAITGKVIATIMLAVTVITFVFGCFVSVFLDNDSLDIGININTVNSDTSIRTIEDNQEKDILIFSKGDLVISKKEDNLKYVDIFNEAKNGTESKLIYLTYSTNPENKDTYSDIYRLTGVTSTSESNAVLTATNLSSGNYETIEINTDNKNYHGVVTSIYVPLLGGILHFANDYAILVCILFILMAAFWCLVLVLIDNQRNKTKKTKEKSKK